MIIEEIKGTNTERKMIIMKTREIIIKVKEESIKDNNKVTREINIKTKGTSMRVKDLRKMKEDMIEAIEAKEVKITRQNKGIIDRITTSKIIKEITKAKEITTMMTEETTIKTMICTKNKNTKSFTKLKKATNIKQNNSQINPKKNTRKRISNNSSKLHKSRNHKISVNHSVKKRMENSFHLNSD